MRSLTWNMLRRNALALLAVSVLVVTLSSVPASALQAEVAGAELISAGKSYNYTGKLPAARYQDPDMNKLTNGAIGAAAVNDPEWVGFFANLPVRVQFDLKQSYTITELRSHHYAGSGGVAWPAVITIRASHDGVNWSEPHVHETGATWPAEITTDWFVVSGLQLAGRFVEVVYEWNESVGGNQNIFISEIELYGTLLAEEEQPILAEKPVPEGLQLVSSGKSYRYAGKAPASRYTDPDRVELTNGITGSLDYRDPEWVGFYADVPVKVVIDLERSVAIKQVMLHLYAGTAGIAWPTFISVAASEDGHTWSETVRYHFSEGFPGEPSVRWFILPDVGLTGRYVEVELIWTEEAGGNRNIFISELEIYE